MLSKSRQNRRPSGSSAPSKECIRIRNAAIRSKILSGFYDRPHVLREVARAILAAGDLS